jgi:serine/threonine protein kinase
VIVKHKLQEKDSDASIKLADFGFAKRTLHGTGMKTFCGTPKYMPPEIFSVKTDKNTYDCLCDMWSVGVVMYALIAGYLPFDEKTTPEVEGKVMKGDYSFYEDDWGQMTPSLRLMVSQLLEVDPRKRMTADHAVECEWMGLDSEELSVSDLSASKERMSTLRDSLRKEKKTMKQVWHAVSL